MHTVIPQVESEAKKRGCDHTDMPTQANDQSVSVAVTTAGMRGTYWDPARLPSGTTLTVHALKTDDGSMVTGYLFRRGGERAVVSAMHPRELVVPQYVVPEVLLGGCAVWVQGARSVGSDLRLEHESALLDLAAGQRFLESEGFTQRLLLGISGGGPLGAFYIQQSGLLPGNRILKSPGGKPTGLHKALLPSPQGMIFVSAHPGQGKLLLSGIDPSVTDENDPLGTDESISPFNPANGFKRPPQSSAYSAEFVERYRAAQLARVGRIDRKAYDLIGRRNDARKRLKQRLNSEDEILAAHSPIFTVWRTDADLRCYDLSLDPSERAYGSLWGGNPFASNYGSIGFGRVCTPESWLSNWSALSSNASMEKCAPSVIQPTLMIEYTGDNSVFPADADLLFSQIGSTRKLRHRVHGNHHGQPVGPDKPNGQIEAGIRIRAWLAEQNFI